MEAFETFDGRVIAGAVVSADRPCWAPVLDGVLALSQTSAGSPPKSADDLAEIGIPSPLFSGHREWISTTDTELARVPFGAMAEPASCRGWDVGNAPKAGRQPWL